jgi:zinc/manganese transport system permease protein
MDFSWLVLPFLACLVLTGIHAYLGIHVIERGVIFVDLALAQIAALGATIALLVGGFGVGSNGAWFFSLGFTLIGAGIFALTRMRETRVPQEAIIGIVYAVASAAAIVVVAEANDPHGAEHIRDLLAGNILYVTKGQILKTALMYAGVGAVHYVFRKQFVLISMDHDRAVKEGLNVPLWDFLFYATFGFVITSSVQIAGVLLVFSFLVVPAVFAVLFASSLRNRLLLGWGLGAFVSLVGLSVSYTRPSGPVIVTMFGLALLVAGVGRYLVRAERKGMAVLKVATVGAAVALVIIIGPLLFDPEEHQHESTFAHPAAHEHEASEEEAHAAEDLLDTEMLVLGLEASECDADRFRYAAALFRRGDAKGTVALRELRESGEPAVAARAARLLAE